ncbi:alpha/beta hydrolase [Paenarthrobacter nitroguajacolicus]|nr:alpha/beta hydrolase [Paenarthrobacter nitroguajacolicus]
MMPTASTEAPMHVVIVPGINGSDADHWQSHWERSSTDWKRIAPTSWDEPEVDDWITALDAAVGDSKPVLVTHSLGCLVAAQWSFANAGRVAGMFLVAVPDPLGPNYPEGGPRFGDDLYGQIPMPAVLLTSSNDPYCTPERSRQFADTWGAAQIDIGPQGHINSASGLGEWQEGRNLLTAFAAGLSAQE